MKIVFLVLAFLSLGIGVIGIVLPVLPTTPFLLLTLYLLSKSSTRYYNWLTNTSFYKKHIQSFHENRTMTFVQKWRLLLIVDGMLLLSFIRIEILGLRILLVVVFLYKHYYFNKYITVI